jgi:proteasome lid subunit RPN8/RPN11
MKLPKEAIQHVEACYPQEAGGFLIRVQGQIVYRPLTNVAARPDINFRMHPAERLTAQQSGEIVGFVHSHPDESAAPSRADLLAHDECGWWDFIISVCRGVAVDVVGIPPSGAESRRPLCGRAFEHGVDDCLTLVRDYYAAYEGITLKDYPREDGWWERGGDLYRQHLPEAGFVEIPREELLPGDLITMKILSRVENHGAIWLGDGVIIHHLYGQVSTTDEYRAAFIQRTSGFWRHREKGSPRWASWQQVW